nr:unnamed protein product [Callosobruchus analis]CAI5868949.1 unnamed protein product [Callosobruchus analis]
MVKPVSTLLLV